MPPSKSGIADYSAALLAELRTRAAVTVFDRAPAAFDPTAFDIALYQLGNNPDHAFVYETALRHPGVLVVHEANLHHLLADLTIRRNDWDAYVRECAFDGGEPARQRAELSRTLTVGPDYEGVPMLRRITASARGVIAHSDYVLSHVRAAGFTGPAAVIPHGAWVGDPPLGSVQPNRHDVRDRLGLDDSTPLIGIFGHLKPYKRIPETLRALRRLVRIDERVKLILGGEPHPDLALPQLLRSLDLEEHVRVLGYTPESDFVGYIQACDIVVNLRYPTVGETSGTLLRALSAARPVLISDVGAFAELPDDVCLKVPVNGPEEELIFEYLNLLVARPEVGREIGRFARAWVERECAWSVVADKYLNFLQSVAEGSAEGTLHPEVAAPEQEESPPPITPVDPAYLRTWATTPEATEYLDVHALRLARTVEITPPGDDTQSVLEMGAYMQITPALKYKLGYGHIRGCYYGPPGRIDHKHISSTDGLSFECLIDHFDAENHIFPYPDASFDTVLCCELIEHLQSDPMHMMSEIHRILKPHGHLVLTTPNITSSRAIRAILSGHHPGFFTAYIKPHPDGIVEARHNREYAPREIEELLTASGMELLRLETGPFRDPEFALYHWVERLLERLEYSTDLRGDGIYALARKTGPIQDRWPAWLYA